MSKNEELLNWAAGNEESYANSYIATAEILARNEVYEAMGTYLALTTFMMESQYRLPEDRPIVHLDVGSGTGDTLVEMAKTLDKADRSNYLLIGVDSNTYMCRHAVNKLLELDIPVTHHVADKRAIISVGGVDRLVKTYEPHTSEIDKMDFTPNGRIVIIQDDIRSCKVLDAILKAMESQQGITFVNGISFAQPGFSGDAVMGGKVITDVIEANKDEVKRMALSGEYMNAITTATTKKAVSLLQFGSTYTMISRFIGAKGIADLYENTTGNKFPEDNFAQLQARIFLSMILLGIHEETLRPKLGAVLIEDYNTIEDQTPIEYASYNPGGGPASKKNPNYGSYDLFAASTMRKDLHPMGNSGTGFTIKTGSERGGK